MGILIDNPSKGKKGCIWGIILILIGVFTIDSIGIYLVIFGIILLVIGKLINWFYN